MLRLKRRTTNTIGMVAFGILGIVVLVALGLEEIRSRNAQKRADIIANWFANREEGAWNNRKLIDPWGTEFEVENEGEKIRVISAGPDRAINTADDIKSEWHGKNKLKKRIQDEAEPELEPEKSSGWWQSLKSKINEWNSDD